MGSTPRSATQRSVRQLACWPALSWGCVYGRADDVGMVKWDTDEWEGYGIGEGKRDTWSPYANSRRPRAARAPTVSVAQLAFGTVKTAMRLAAATRSTRRNLRDQIRYSLAGQDTRLSPERATRARVPVAECVAWLATHKAPTPQPTRLQGRRLRHGTADALGAIKCLVQTDWGVCISLLWREGESCATLR